MHWDILCVVGIPCAHIADLRDAGLNVAIAVLRAADGYEQFRASLRFAALTRP